MRLRLFAAVLAGGIIGFGLTLILSSPSCALGYPIPQPKGCPVFWDSKQALNVAKNHPFSSGRYFADHDQVIFGTKDGGAVMPTHDRKGCLRTFPVAPWHAEKFLTDQEDS